MRWLVLMGGQTCNPPWAARASFLSTATGIRSRLGAFVMWLYDAVFRIPTPNLHGGRGDGERWKTLETGPDRPSTVPH